MGIHWYTVSMSSCAYIYCILTLLCGDGLTAPYYDDRSGQPELQQAMDNAPLQPARNLLPFPSEQHRDISFLLTEKTSALLSEALHMLQKIKDVRERKWLEAFILRLGSLATDLEEDNSVKTTNEEQIEVRKQKKEPQKDDKNLFKQSNSQHVVDFNNMGFVHGQKHNILESVRGVDLGRNEGASDIASQKSKETVNRTVFPSWQQVLETVYEGDSRALLREPAKYFVPVEPTMSDEMERELRAGKIVVLSDSLVRTNFKPKHTNNKKGSVTQPTSFQVPENDEIHYPSKLIRNNSN